MRGHCRNLWSFSWNNGEGLSSLSKLHGSLPKPVLTASKFCQKTIKLTAGDSCCSFLSDQCKETEENNKWERLSLRDLVKKMRDTKGTFHAKMDTIKDTNGMDLTEAEDIKKRWQEYTEELYKKDIHDPDNHNGGITHPQPDILECEVKWALGSITMHKASGGDGIPVDLCQILKDDAVKVLHSICQQTWKTQQWPQDWKRSVFIPVPKKGSAKECSNYLTVALISHTSKIILKILQARLQQYVNHELPDVQAGFRKGRGTRDQIANIHWIIEKQESSRKTSISALLTMPKPLTVWITTNYGKFLNRWEYKATLPASWEICIQVRKTVRTGHGKTDWFQIGKGVKAVYCHPAYLTYMQSTSCKMLG